MKKILVLSTMTLVILACALPASKANPTAAPTAGASTQNQIGTFVAQTVQAQQPALTEATVPPVLTPTSQVSAATFTPSQWNGSFLEPWGARVSMSLVIEKVTGATFSAKMNWRFSTCSALMSLTGEIIDNISTASEQSRWALHPDFRSGDTGGIWLRWTQLETLSGANCYVNTGDWWYAHIRSDGHMIGMRFMNPTDPQRANGDLDLTEKTP